MRHNIKPWMKLDNAATIYPAVRNGKWNALFRLSANMDENVDRDILQAALLKTLPRFPAFTKKLRRSMFWYYLDEIDALPEVEEDVANPCVRMDFREKHGYMFRVRYHEKRIAVEIFHVLTDGTGGLCFLKTLIAEYLTLRYGIAIPRGDGILDCADEPTDEETEDSFVKYARKETLSRSEMPSYCIRGEITPHFMHIITGIVDADKLHAAAKRYDASVGEFLTAVLMCSIADVQQKDRSRRARKLPVKVNVPVNLRAYYPTKTLRNFSSYVNPGIETRLGRYTFEETVSAVKHYMRLELDEKRMNARFTTNVVSVQNPAIKVAPLPVKKFVLRRVYEVVGDRYTASSVSNLGLTKLPDAMAAHITRMDFMLGPLYRNPVTCAVITYGGKAVINITRTIKECEVERGFYTRLVKMGLHVLIESNDISEN